MREQIVRAGETVLWPADAGLSRSCWLLTYVYLVHEERSLPLKGSEGTCVSCCRSSLRYAGQPSPTLNVLNPYMPMTCKTLAYSCYHASSEATAWMSKQRLHELAIHVQLEQGNSGTRDRVAQERRLTLSPSFFHTKD